MQIPVLNTYFVYNAFLCADTKHSCFDYFYLGGGKVAQKLFHRYIWEMSQVYLPQLHVISNSLAALKDVYIGL